MLASFIVSFYQNPKWSDKGKFHIFRLNVALIFGESLVGLVRVFRARYLKMKLYMIAKQSKSTSSYSIYKGTNNFFNTYKFQKIGSRFSLISKIFQKHQIM
jgi:hypothetical protein